MPPSGRQTTAQERTSSLAMPPVKIVEVARVVVPAAEPSALLWLSALDAPWLSFALMQYVFIFDLEDEDDHAPTFPSIVASLRASLESTLARFVPLAGRIVFLPSKGDAAIDCTEGGVAGGVRFLVAEADDADAGRLSGDADHDVETFRRLVPGLDVGALPAEVLAVQVTRLRGGVAVGVAMHHAVADGRSAWRFIEAWAAACRGDRADTTAPSFDRTVVELPGGRQLVRSTLWKYTPHLPLAPQPPVGGPIVPRRTFIVTQQQINQLKQRITDLTSTPSSAAAVKPSSFVAVSALSWASFVRSKHPSVISADNDVYLFVLKDCRGPRGGFNPPVSETYFGSCVTGCLAKAMARDLLAEDGVAAAAVALDKAVRRAAEDPLALWDWMALKSLPLDRVLNMSGSTRFQAYEATDFGWGALSRTELVSMKNDRQVVLVAAKGGRGGVQASAVMHPDHMDSFSSHFLMSLD